jgi:hypothetical protein
MRVDANTQEIAERIAAIAPLLTGLAGFVDFADTPITSPMPALGVVSHRVLEVQPLTLSQFMLVEEFVAFAYIRLHDPAKDDYTPAVEADVMQWFLPILTLYSARERLELNGGDGIVFFVDVRPDGTPRRTVVAKKKYLGLSFRLRVTTHHSY